MADGRDPKRSLTKVMLVVVEVVEAVVSSSTIRDFHKNSFWQHHCDDIRKLYTNSGVHTVRSQIFHFQATQMNSSSSTSNV